MDVKQQLLAITPLDGRYANKLHPLREISSEYGLIKRRVSVEIAWLRLLGSGILPDIAAFDQDSHNYLQRITDSFSVDDACQIKELERKTNHDVKAVELWLRQKLAEHQTLQNHQELIHFGLTSEDINNVSYALLMRDMREQVILPIARQIQDTLKTQANNYADVAMLARTHGQPATPTTLGKEINVYVERMRNSLIRLESVALKAKCNGATGNYNALLVAYSEVDWPQVCEQFITSFGLTFNPVTTQIEPHDWLAAICQKTVLLNTILTDLARDMWLYISYGYLSQVMKPGEVGSSTMPHKVNPIDFENAEANFGIANALLNHLATKLPISRLQRDLSDSSTLRSIGEAYGHTLLGMISLNSGLNKVHPNLEKIAHDLDQEWSILTEAIQTLMRRYGRASAYETIKEQTRGKSLTHVGYHELIESIDLPDEAKTVLRKLTPASYIGLAPQLARYQKE